MAASIFEHLLCNDPTPSPCDAVNDWWPRYVAICGRWPTPIERAIAGGFAADRVAWAFSAGYQAALHALVPGLPDGAMCAFCVTEAAGNSPRAIQATLVPDPSRPGLLRLSGHKKWSTLGPHSGVLLVAAREAGGCARPRIRLVRVRANAPGLFMQPLAPTRFIPEAPHAEVRMENVAVNAGDVLDGDGYDAYVKPFRTVEDAHINAALLAYLLREARARRWPGAWIEQVAALLVAFAGIAGRPADSPVTHVVIAGALHSAGRLIEDADAHWSVAQAEPAAQRWARDRVLLGLAQAARDQRIARAWERLTPA